MDYLNNTINTLPHERGQHLKFENRCEIKALHKQGYSYRQIAKALNCSPSTVGYELKRGTATKTTHRGRPTEYVPSRGQAVYYENRKRSGRKKSKPKQAKNVRIFGRSIDERPDIVKLHLEDCLLCRGYEFIT